MEIRKYEALLTAMEAGSLAAAAQKLGYTTSGMSRMIASIEEESGLVLLNRSKNGVEPTAACSRLLPSIRALVQAAARLQDEMSAFQGNISGTVRVGCAYDYYYPFLSETIAVFRRQFPGVVVRIENGYSSGLARRLHEHELDLALITKREIKGRWILLKKDEMVALVPAGSELAARKAVPVSVFASHDYIETHPDADNDSSHVFLRNGVVPNVRFQTQDSTATLSMVRAGLGITLTNKLNADVWENGGITLLPLRPRQKMEIGIAVSDEAGASTEYFIQELQRQIMAAEE